MEERGREAFPGDAVARGLQACSLASSHLLASPSKSVSLHILRYCRPKQETYYTKQHGGLLAWYHPYFFCPSSLNFYEGFKSSAIVEDSWWERVQLEEAIFSLCDRCRK
jgi:hypothetical protein